PSQTVFEIDDRSSTVWSQRDGWRIVIDNECETLPLLNQRVAGAVGSSIVGYQLQPVDARWKRCRVPGEGLFGDRLFRPQNPVPPPLLADLESESETILPPV